MPKYAKLTLACAICLGAGGLLIWLLDAR
jgi:hypothetical protein